MRAESLIRRVKAGQGPLWTAARRAARWWRCASVPTVPVLHCLLYYERALRCGLWSRAKEALYYVPLFRSRCAQCGVGLRLENGLPEISGNLELMVGNHVTINGVTTFCTNNVSERPILRIGDHAYIGHQVTISVASEVTIGRYCLIADRVLIADNDGHPLDPAARAAGLPADPEAVAPIVLGDHVWVGSRAVILKGVVVGAGAVIGAGAVVTRNVPPMAVVAGNPARVVRQIEGSLPTNASEGMVAPR